MGVIQICSQCSMEIWEIFSHEAFLTSLKTKYLNRLTHVANILQVIAVLQLQKTMLHLKTQQQVPEG